jgi:hypothetical protein
MSLQDCAVPGAPDPREVFVSYRRLDDLPPPGKSKDRGFVCYLLRQLRYDLSQMGVPDAILWQDRGKIGPGDDFPDVIREALNRAELFLAVLSKNYVTSSWCDRELSTMVSRVMQLDAQARKRRIFRVDKHRVPEHLVPKQLQTIDAVRFYEENDADGISEYYWRGKVRRTREYEGAIYALAQAICERLDEIGIPRQPRVEAVPAALSDYDVCPEDRPVVFVAKPALDMIESYRTIVSELEGTGYRVTPDPDEDLGELGDEELRSRIYTALAEAEASVHLLGEKIGGRAKLVPMQLAAAAEESRKRTDFVRMIWAPEVLTTSEDGIGSRDPLTVVDRFGVRLPSDKIDGDTASRFNEFVLQRLAKKHRRRLEEKIRNGRDS